jgi:molybdate transport system substrate-binding protein
MFVGPAPRGWAAGSGSPEARRRAARAPCPPRRAGARRIALLTPLVALLAATVLALTGCADTATTGGGSGGFAEIKVFAAASLTDSFTKLAAQYTAAHPGVNVTCNFASSSDLATQIQQGAPADVFASADTINMGKVADLVGAPRTFAGNRLTIAVEPGNPEGIAELADLADKNLKVVLAAPEVPAGKYAREILAKAGVTVTPVSLEESVKGVAAKVMLGEADAGIVYVTDVSAARGKLDEVTIPDDQNLIATYPIAVVNSSKHTADAQGFMDYVLSPSGQKVLADYGFLPPPATE